MSLIKTLAKVAVGVAVAKGVAGMTKGATSSGGGSIFGGARTQTSRSGGGLQDMLGSVLSGRGGSVGQSGGLGGLLEGLAQASRTTGGRSTQPSTGSLGDLLNQSFEKFGEPDATPSAEQEEQAGLMLKAMLQAAKADGRIDADEKAKLMDHLGDISAEERAFVDRELAADIDIDGLARSVPRGMESQIYLMSVMAIDLDKQGEAQYLHELATAMGLGQQQVNAIHEQVGAPALYS